ncbi:MAG: hypothetical protein AAFR61_03015 [Bacteroidota bacterium]
MSELENYIQYLDSDDEFSYFLRMEYIWDDQKYLEMLQHVKDVVVSFGSKDVLPKKVIYFFTGTIDMIVGIVSKDVFFATTPEGYQEQSYRELVEQRKNELIELKKKFFGGDYYLFD